MRLFRIITTLIISLTLIVASVPGVSATSHEVIPDAAPIKRVVKKVVKKKVVKKIIKKKVKKHVKKEAQTPAAPAASQEHAVAIRNFSFQPATLTIKKGDKVIFTQEDAIGHTVSTDPHPAHTQLPGFESPILNQGQKFEFVFDQVGTWTYHCSPHPNMTGSIVVTE